MTRLAGLLVMLASAMLVSASPVAVSAQEGPSPETEAEAAVLDAHRALIEAYATTDVDELAALLAPSEDLLIFHPRGNLEFQGLPDVRRGLEQMLKDVGPSTFTDEWPKHLVVHGDVAWYTYEITMQWDGADKGITARGTEIWVEHAGGWRLAHAHWSELRAIGYPEDQ